MNNDNEALKICKFEIPSKKLNDAGRVMKGKGEHVGGLDGDAHVTHAE